MRPGRRSTHGGGSSTTCAPTARPRSPELIVIFKAARRLEYLQQNLRILGAPRGETVETAYGLRWQSAGIRGRPPEPGEETLIVFTAQPYLRFTAARFARVVAAAREEGALRLRLELGSRARVSNIEGWQRYMLGGPNPSEMSQVWIFRTEQDPDPGVRPPIGYATAGGDELAWRTTIDRLASDDDYRTAVFLRVTAVRPADETAARPLAPPYRLQAERPYLVRVGSYNPHLGADVLGETRLILFYDELATAVAASGGQGGVPADGTIDLLIEPIVAGPGWLELSASRGDDLLLAASLGWVAEPAPLAPSATAHPSGRTAAIAPSERLLVEREGLALYVEGRYEESQRALASVPLDTLSAEGRATLLAASLREGRLPDPLERVRIADLSRPDVFGLVLDASSALPGDDQARLTEFVVERLVSHDRAGAWLAKLIERPLLPVVLDRLLRVWSEIDPDRAAHARGRLVAAGRIER